MRQQSIEVPGLEHAAPIPLGCRIGPLFASSGIAGRDPANGKIPPNLERQAELCFENMHKILAAAGMDAGDVLKMTVFITDESYRDAVNVHWNALYPDPHKRPARHSLVMPLRGGMMVQLDVLAVAKEA